MTHLLEDEHYRNGHVRAKSAYGVHLSPNVIRLDDGRPIYHRRRRLGTFVVELLFLYGLPVLAFLMFVLGLTGVVYIVLAIGRAIRAIGGP